MRHWEILNLLDVDGIKAAHSATLFQTFTCTVHEHVNWSLHVLPVHTWFFSWFSGFIWLKGIMHFRLTDNSKLSQNLSEYWRVAGLICLSGLLVSLQPCPPCLSLRTDGDEHSFSTKLNFWKIRISFKCSIIYLELNKNISALTRSARCVRHQHVASIVATIQI